VVGGHDVTRNIDLSDAEGDGVGDLGVRAPDRAEDGSWPGADVERGHGEPVLVCDAE
jgi:hypothetical protein